MSTGTGSAARPAWARATTPAAERASACGRGRAVAPVVGVEVRPGSAGKPLGDGANQQRMPCRVKLQAPVARHRRLDPADQLGEPGFRLHHVQFGRRLQRPLQVECPAAERVGERQQDAPDFGRLLFFERHHVVVDLHGAERLEIEAGSARRTAVDDARDSGPVLGADDENVPAVAVGDDLVLKVPRRVAAAQVGLQRVPQARALLPQPVANRPEFAARLVVHLAARVDLLPDVSDLRLERRRHLGQGSQVHVAAGRPTNGGARLVERRQEIGQPEQPDRLERAALDGERRQRGVDVRWRLERKHAAVGQVTDALGGRPEPLRDAARVRLRAERRQPVAAEGRRGKAADRLDDAVELQSVLRGSLHIEAGNRVEEGRTSRPGASRFCGGNLLP